MPLQCELMARDSASAIGREREDRFQRCDDDRRRDKNALSLASREDGTLEPSAALADRAFSKLRLLTFLVIYKEHEQGHP